MYFHVQILEKTDYTLIQGHPFIKKSGNLWKFILVILIKLASHSSNRMYFFSGWRKISFFFNLSFEIRDKSIEFDENRNVQRAEFIVRAYMKYAQL